MTYDVGLFKTFVYAYTGPQLSRPNSSKDVRVANIAVRCNITSLVSPEMRNERIEYDQMPVLLRGGVALFTMSTGLSKITVSLKTRTIAIRSLKRVKMSRTYRVRRYIRK